jgi:hypothetical protein
MRNAIAGMLLVVAGCGPDLTEVVVAIHSDLTPGTEVDGIQVTYQAGSLSSNFNPPLFASLDTRSTFPMSAGFASREDGPASFSVTVQFMKTNGFESLIVVSRKATAVQFVREQTLMFVLPMMRVCACQGTTCPNPGENPDCDDLVDPELVPLDPAIAPRGIEGNVINVGPSGPVSVGGGPVGRPPPSS